MEVDFLSKDQTKIPFLFTGKLSHVDQKSCVMGMGIDITERKRAEEALRASQQIIEGILNAIPVRVFWKDKNLVFLGCNAVFARDAGFGDPKDIIGKDDSQMGWHDQAEAYRKDDRHTIESGNSKFNIEESQTTPDGKTITVLTSKIPLRNSTGQISGVLGTYVDITERKQAEAALEKVNQELVGASRQAGMAEVATSVLHNVGNVLNSVGVSATLVANQVYHSKAANIAKLAALLDQHQADLATFLTTDSRGQTIPAYLASLAESLAAEQTMLLAELGLLRKNIEHIKDIVSLQQANAHTSGVTEPISLPDLLEEALRMNADALARYNVTTIRDYQTRPVVTTDQNRVLQILVNLVRNAKLACVDSGRTDKQITVRTTSDDRNAKIAIIDNGVGIPAENLTRIFHHGFTTRKTGHGFGLHSAALAAKQLGGALTVQSDGPGRGATFTLELPCQLAPPAHENSIR
jgi:PAS domain S-box-containing protein